MEQIDQTKEIVSVKLPETGIMLPNKINVLLCSNNIVIGSQIYIPITEYLKLKEEKQKLESQINTLQLQINESIQLRIMMNGELTKLKEQLKDQDKKINDLQKIVDEYKHTKLYQKVADNLSSIKTNLHDLLCDSESDIYIKSGDSDLYHLCDHLMEYDSKIYTKYSKVKKNFIKWNEIYNDVTNILLKEFNINDIKVFFEIIKIVNKRNNISHNNDRVTLDELKLVSPFAQQIYDCINIIE